MMLAGGSNSPSDIGTLTGEVLDGALAWVAFFLVGVPVSVSLKRKEMNTV